MSRTQQLALSKRSPKVSSAAPLAKKPTRLPHDNLLHAPKENNIALFFVVFVIYVEAELPLASSEAAASASKIQMTAFGVMGVSPWVGCTGRFC